MDHTQLLPPEMKWIVCQHLSSPTDLANLSMTCREMNEVVCYNAYNLARPLIDDGLARLSAEINNLDFRNVDLIVAWRRYLRAYPQHRNPLTMEAFDTEEFVRAYLCANPSFPNRCVYRLGGALEVILGMSDWCASQLLGDESLHSLTHDKEIQALAEAAEGEYDALVDLFQAMEPWSAEMIVAAFEQVKRDPIDDLSWGQGDFYLYWADGDGTPIGDPIEYPGEIEDLDILADEDRVVAVRVDQLETNPGPLTFLPESLRNRLSGLIGKAHGFDYTICTYSAKGERLINQITRRGDQDGMLWAALLEELTVEWW